MGLLDILNGMQNGPRGQSEPTKPGESKGMSPMTMALLALLAFKAFQKSGGLGSILGGSPSPGQPAPKPGGGLGDILAGGAPSNQAGPSTGGLGDILGGMLGGQSGNKLGPSSGNLGDILGGMLGGPQGRAGASAGGLGDILGGLFGGKSAGPALNGGLHSLLEDLEQNGQGDVAKSWVSSGQNRAIAPDDLANALGADTITALSSQTGMSRDALLAELSQNLPQLVDQLTPDGRLPTEHEASRW